MSGIEKWLRDGILVFDGAMGTMLQSAGLAPGECPEGWNIAHPDRVASIHRSYVEAGARVVETNTFGGSRLKLSEYGLAEEAPEINRRGAALARSAVGDRALVAGSIGPTGRLIEPLGDLGFDRAVEVFAEQARALAVGGADLLIVETMGDLAEARAAVIGAREACALPIIAQLTFERGGRTFTGTDAVTAAVVLEAVGAGAVGANCSGGPAELMQIIRAMAAVTRLPLSMIPNAGLPELIGGRTVFPQGPEEFGSFGPEMVKAGAAIVGGCCGTTPEHIRALAHSIRGLRPAPRELTPRTSLASRTRTVFFAPENLPILIGERINPTARKKLAVDIREGSFALVRHEARGQMEAGAHVLDVNVGVPGLDEPAAMKEAVLAVQAAAGVPQSIDSANPAALEAGLRAFTGKALVNSVTGEEKRLEAVLPLVKKYGAAVIGLTLDDRGIPMTAEGRLDVARRILDRALALGIPRENLLIDCLVLTAGAQQKEVMETPKAVRLVKEELGLTTVLGISNVSYGLPRRDLLNSAYLVMNLAHGLDAAIVNPHDERVWESVRTARLLMNRDRDAAEYIQYAASRPEPAAKPPAEPTAKPAAKPPAETAGDGVPSRLYRSVMNGEREGIESLVEEALKLGHEPMAIMNQFLIPAIEEVGEKYGAGVFFLPQLMLSAETMKKAFARLKREFSSREAGSTGGRRGARIVLGTVEGDIHDIGKNIVGVLLENHGFEVIDLGKSVPAEEFLRASEREDADVIGLSALMTTTMPRMKEVVEERNRRGHRARIMIGGAVTTPAYAAEIGADGHARDARAAVELVRRLGEGQGQ